LSVQENQNYPELTTVNSVESRSGLHAFAKLLGIYTRACAPRRKLWWHISLKPVVDGFTTGVLENNRRLFEFGLNFRSLAIDLRIAGEDAYRFSIQGESAESMTNKLFTTLSRHNITVDPDRENIDAARYEIDREWATCQSATAG